MKRHFKSALAAACAVFWMADVFAQVQSAQVTQEVSSPLTGNTYSTAGTFSSSGCFLADRGDEVCGTGKSTVSLINGVSFMSVSASTTGYSPGQGYPSNTSYPNLAIGNSGLSYWFKVDGPVNTVVPLVFEETQTSSGSGSLAYDGWNSISKVILYESGVGDLSDTVTCIGAADTCGPGKYYGDQTSVTTQYAFTATAGAPSDLFEVSIEAGTEAGVGSESGGSFTTTVDPSVSFASGFDSQGLSIEFSPDVGSPLAAVPEPPSWWLMVAAAILLLALRRSSSTNIATTRTRPSIEECCAMIFSAGWRVRKTNCMPFANCTIASMSKS